ncbi:MAG: Rv1678 family membrane protein [Nocardioides sp.]
MSVARSEPSGRTALALGAVGVIAPVFALSTGSNNNFVVVDGLGLVVFPVLGLVAVLGVVLDKRPVVVLAGAGFAVAALVQLVQFGRSTNWLGGNGSTFAMLMALGIGLLVTALTPPPAPSPDKIS